MNGKVKLMTLGSSSFHSLGCRKYIIIDNVYMYIHICLKKSVIYCLFVYFREQRQYIGTYIPGSSDLPVHEPQAGQATRQP